jgi:hypothetical protein
MEGTRRDALLGMLKSDEVERALEVAAGAARPDASWEVATSSNGIHICAPSFTTCIERLWIESEIQRKLDNDMMLLTDAERGIGSSSSGCGTGAADAVQVPTGAVERGGGI